MDVRNYQKMFSSPPPFYQSQQNSIPSMNFCCPPPPSFHRHHHQHLHQQQQQYYQQQQQLSMMNSTFNNPFLTMTKPSTMNFGYQNYNNNRFMSSHFQHQQQLQQRTISNFQLPSPPTFNLPSTSSFDPASITNSSPSLTLSTDDGSTKEETAREIFFRTLSASLKEANKFYSGKTTTWKNPFLYKTHLCENHCKKLYCRFGVNCWYAHGPHELRCIPESDDLPDPVFISQYLSFLGLPKQTLDQIIQYAFYVSNLMTSSSASESSLKSSTLPSFDSTPSVSLSPIKNENVQKIDNADQMNSPKTNNYNNSNKFLSSLTSNGGWGEIESAINGTIADTESSENKANFGKSFHLFGNSFNQSQNNY